MTEQFEITYFKYKNILNDITSYNTDFKITRISDLT